MGKELGTRILTEGQSEEVGGGVGKGFERSGLRRISETVGIGVGRGPDYTSMRSPAG